MDLDENGSLSRCTPISPAFRTLLLDRLIPEAGPSVLILRSLAWCSVGRCCSGSAQAVREADGHLPEGDDERDDAHSARQARRHAQQAGHTGGHGSSPFVGWVMACSSRQCGEQDPALDPVRHMFATQGLDFIFDDVDVNLDNQISLVRALSPDAPILLSLERCCSFAMHWMDRRSGWRLSTGTRWCNGSSAPRSTLKRSRQRP